MFRACARAGSPRLKPFTRLGCLLVQGGPLAVANCLGTTLRRFVPRQLATARGPPCTSKPPTREMKSGLPACLFPFEHLDGTTPLAGCFSFSYSSASCPDARSSPRPPPLHPHTAPLPGPSGAGWTIPARVKGTARQIFLG